MPEPPQRDRVNDVAAWGGGVGATEGRFGRNDFSYFSERISSRQLLVGASQPGRIDRVHNSDYQPDKCCIGLGVAALSRAVLDMLSLPPPLQW